MGIIDRLFGRSTSTAIAQIEPKAMDMSSGYRGRYAREANSFLAGFMPTLRDQSDVVGGSWEKQAGRVIHAYQHSGFIRGVLDVSTAQVVGSGLRMSARPDGKSLGWSPEFTAEFARKFESRFAAWAGKAYNCDAGGQMNFGQQQQAFYLCSLGFGEGLALLPNIRRPGVANTTKIKLLPPSRIVNKSDGVNLVQGVRIDEWGMPLSYVLFEKKPDGFLTEREVPARDRDGRPNVVHRFMPAVGVTRNVADIATGMKSYRQFDQYSDANLTQKMIRTIFGAVVKSNLQGVTAFEGMMTEGDQLNNGAVNLTSFLGAKGDFYDGAKIDLSQHGRIAQMFPGDELDFVESKAAGDDFDPIARWLWLEIAAAAGVSYESATGDYRGATYSSVRMAGAKEWLGVMRKRDGIVVPFCQAAAEAFLEEEIATDRITIPGGLAAYLENRDLIAACLWTGPAQPQADDFKTARAHEVRKDMGATTLADIFSSYGQDWDDAMRQQAVENKLADELGLPRPWAPIDILQTEKGLENELNAPPNGQQGDRNGSQKKPVKQQKGGGRNIPERDPANALAGEVEDDPATALEDELKQDE